MFHLPTHTPALKSVAAFLGQPTEVLIAPQTSCSAARPPEAVPYVDAAGASLLGRPPTAQDTAAGKEIAAFVAEGKTAAFSEDAGFNFYNQRQVVTNPTQLLNLYRNDQVDISEILHMLNEQAFDTVIFTGAVFILSQYLTPLANSMKGSSWCR